ncbi:MAG: ABC-type transport auxiliary lipoprotein family protein [Rhodomicrobium sp.]|jgi:phospholipid/cholesterol/gamma-HCH transport system substrate-binding protein
MEIKARYVLIGLFTLAVIVAGFAFVYWLDTQGGIGKRTTYEVRFQHTVSGLLKGSAVLFNGIRVGEVTGLALVPDQPKEVDATIAIDATTPVRADTQVSLEFQGLTGVAAVTLTGGSADAPLIAASPGQPPRLAANEAAGQTMSEAARQALARIDRILAENAGDLRTMISNLSSFAEALGKNSGKVDGILAGLERMTGSGKASGAAFDLSALPPGAALAKPLDKQLVVADVNALLTYDSDRVLTQVDGGQLTGLGNAKWSDNLSKLMQARIVQSFENTGSLGLASRPIEGAAPDFQLLIEIRKFQIAPGPERAAVAEISAKLVSADGRIAAARIFDDTAPVKSQEDADAVKALNEAFGKILGKLIPWTAETTAGGAEKPQPQPAQPKRRGQARG